MKGAVYDGTWMGALAQNRVLKWSQLFQTLVILVLLFAVLGKDRTVVLVPPGLEERAEVSKSASSESVSVSWGLYLATLFGNVTPRTAEFLSSAVAPYLAPALYQPVMEAIDAQATQIKDEQITVSFAPTTARFDRPSGRVVVSGELVTRGLSGIEKRTTRTYEFAIATRHYRVVVEDLKVYDGAFKKETPGQEAS